MNPSPVVTDEHPTEHIDHQKTWTVEWLCEKWNSPEAHAAGEAPAEVVRVTDNLLVTGGINFLLNRLITATPDATYPPYGTGAFIAVGNSTTAAASGQSDLIGTQAEAAMDATYPQVSLTTATWKSTFTSLVANFAWEEVSVKNGSGAVSATVKILNRKVQTFGTKASGTVWTMTLSVTIT